MHSTQIRAFETQVRTAIEDIRSKVRADCVRNMAFESNEGDGGNDGGNSTSVSCPTTIYPFGYSRTRMRPII